MTFIPVDKTSPKTRDLNTKIPEKGNASQIGENLQQEARIQAKYTFRRDSKTVHIALITELFLMNPIRIQYWHNANKSIFAKEI